jgi:hypothetical protein
MKTNLLVLTLTAMTIFSGMKASAGTRLCYVQEEDESGIFKKALAHRTVSTAEVSPILLLEEGDLRYTVQMQEGDQIIVAVFSKVDETSLIMAVASGADGLVLINKNQKRLIGCKKVNN